MTAISNTLNIPYYHREYSNDIPINRQSDIPKRVALVALPFLSLYKPLSFPISMGMGSMRLYNSANKLINDVQTGTSKEIVFAAFGTSIAVIALASSIFAHPVGMAITTSQDIFLELITLIAVIKQGDIEESLISLTKITNNVVYLTLMCSGGLELSIVSLALQAIILIISSRDEFSRGNYLEAAGNILMSSIRIYQGYSQFKILQKKWDSKKAIDIERKRERTPEEIREFTKILIKYANNPFKWNALDYATYLGDLEAVQILLKNGIDPNCSTGSISVNGSTIPAWMFLFIDLKNNKEGKPIFSQLKSPSLMLSTSHEKEMFRLFSDAGVEYHQRACYQQVLLSISKIIETDKLWSFVKNLPKEKHEELLLQMLRSENTIGFLGFVKYIDNIDSIFASAILLGNCEVIKYFIDTGIDVNCGLIKRQGGIFNIASHSKKPQEVIALLLSYGI